jgi:hypothetical protein
MILQVCLHMLLIKVCLRVFPAEHYVVHYICIHGVLHNHDSFFKKTKVV